MVETISTSFCTPVLALREAGLQMRVSEAVADFLVRHGTGHVFMLTGGGAMFLNDALTHTKGLTPVFCHHEQACAMAAEGYARITGKPGVINVTTGPGAINALNGVYGAFTDSVPMMVISGQVKLSTHLRATPVEGLRQLGDQEVDIAAIAAPICKKVFSLFEANRVETVMREAWALCQEGRPGPVWIDIPIDVQSATAPPMSHESPELNSGLDSGATDLGSAADEIVRQLALAKRPVIMFGTGVRVSGTQQILLEAAEALRVPVSTAWTHDTIESSHPLFAGRAGTIGSRFGNFVVQSCDVLLVLGSRLNIRQTSYNFQSFAKNARIIQIDIDAAELRKPTVSPHQSIVAALQDFAPLFRRAAMLADFNRTERDHWLRWIEARRAAFPLVAAHQRTVQDDGRINPYFFLEQVFARSQEGDIIVTGNASACIISFQVALIRSKMRMFSNSGSASMGYDIPAAIGAAFAAPNRRVFCIAGDGSAQLNIQELQTIVQYRLNIVIVILANDGYLSIRSSQINFFKRVSGESSQSGVSFPDYCKVATAYGITSFDIRGADFEVQLESALATPGPMLIQAHLDGSQGFEPRMSSRQMPDGSIVSPSLEDLHPFLSADELQWAMNTDLIDR